MSDGIRVHPIKGAPEVSGDKKPFPRNHSPGPPGWLIGQLAPLVNNHVLYSSLTLYCNCLLCQLGI